MNDTEQPEPVDPPVPAHTPADQPNAYGPAVTPVVEAKEEPAVEGEADVKPAPEVPTLGLQVHDMGDGNAGIIAVEPDGTQHAITMPAAHGALIAFMDFIRSRIPELGSRATAWTVKKPGDEEAVEPPTAA